MTRQELLKELSHLPESKRSSFTDQELDILARLMDNCRQTKQPQIDLRKIDSKGTDTDYSLVLVAPDWAGLLDAVSGVVHQQGHNIKYLTALVNRTGEVAIIVLLLSLSPDEAKKLETHKNELVSLLRMAARGGLSIKRMITIGASKIRVYSGVLEELSQIATPEEFKEITQPGGELEQFITTRSEAYLTERFPKDLARLILTQHRFQKAVAQGKGIQVKVSNIKTTKENLTGITVAGRDEHMSLDAVLEAIREFVPDYKRKYDKEFVSPQGVAVERVEITDGDFNAFPEEVCVALENFLRGRLHESKIRRRDMRMKSGAELIGRILVPRLIDETETTARPQMLILPEGMEEGVAQFRVVLVNSGDDRSEAIRQCMDEVEGIVVSSLKVSKAKDKHVCLFTLFVDTSYFHTEEDIYSAMKTCVSNQLPDIRDFDQGMRQMAYQRLQEIQTRLADRGISSRFIKRVFYSMDDAYRVTTPVEEVAEEIMFVYDLFTRHLSTGQVVADYIRHKNHYVFGVAGPHGTFSMEPYTEMFKDYNAIFTGMEIMGVNIYLFKIRKSRAVKPRTLLKEMRSKEAKV